MIITIKGRRYRLSPGLTEFVRGFQQGLGWGLAFGAPILIVAGILLASWRLP